MFQYCYFCGIIKFETMFYVLLRPDQTVLACGECVTNSLNSAATGGECVTNSGQQDDTPSDQAPKYRLADPYFQVC